MIYVSQLRALGVILPVMVLGHTVSHTGTGRAGRNDDSVQDGFRILISLVGGHALTSLKGEALSSRYSYLLGCYAFGLLIT